MRICVLGSRCFMGSHCIRHLKTLPEVHIVSTDSSTLNLLDVDAVGDFFRSQDHLDMVIHFCVKGGRRAVKEDGQTCMDNLLLYDNVVKFKSHFDHFMYFSSGAALNAPQSPYGFSKKIIEELMAHQPNLYSLRIFNCYGKILECGRRHIWCVCAKIAPYAMSYVQGRARIPSALFRVVFAPS